VTETRSSLLDFVHAFRSIRFISFHSQKLTVPTPYVSTLIILRVPLDQFILLSTSGEPHVLICRLRPILQSTVSYVPSRRACLISSLLPIFLCASDQSHPSSFFLLFLLQCFLRINRPTFAPPLPFATSLHPETYHCSLSHPSLSRHFMLCHSCSSPLLLTR
jgi:hypothetical protein